MPIKVAIYEDNNSLRNTLSFLIQGDSNLELTGAYPNCTSVVENCAAGMPDVILMDIDMPGMTGIEATSLIKARYPEINILIFTIFEDREKVYNALCAGANGYLLKRSNAVQIIEAITELYHGGSPMTGEIARMVLNFFSSPNSVKNNDYALSAREMEVLKRLVDGDSYKMIGDKCFISIGTVRGHINNIYKKLHVNSKSEAVIKAMKERLI
jgi:DNA-binding NarL/FixJ family response regulator